MKLSQEQIVKIEQALAYGKKSRGPWSVELRPERGDLTILLIRRELVREKPAGDSHAGRNG